MTSFKHHISDFRELLDRLDTAFTEAVSLSVAAIAASAAKGGKILVFGNGGSSADASHFAAEFVGRYLHERRALPAISLTAESASVTAIANDYGYDRIFERQIEAFGARGDIAIGLSTSGRSANVIRGLKAARERGLVTIALTGAVGLSEPVAEILLAVPSSKTFEIQEVHKIVLHTICAEVEQMIVDGSAGAPIVNRQSSIVNQNESF